MSMHASPARSTPGEQRDLEHLAQQRKQAQSAKVEHTRRREDAERLVHFLRHDVLVRDDVRMMQGILARQGPRRCVNLHKKIFFMPEGIRLGGWLHQPLRAQGVLGLDVQATQDAIAARLAELAQSGVRDQSAEHGPSMRRWRAVKVGKKTLKWGTSPLWGPVVGVMWLFTRR